jgi:ribosome-binding protein aMBF1 (putative translation factor)
VAKAKAPARKMGRVAEDIKAGLDEVRRFLQGEKGTGVVMYPPGVPPKLVRAIHKAKVKREKRGLSVADVALAVGVSEAQIVSIEKCRLKTITVEVLDEYAKAVGVELRFSVGATAKTK